MKKLLTKKFIFITVAVLVIAAAAVFFYVRSSSNGKQIITVTRGDIFKKVLVSGNTKPLSSVELSFPKGGRVAKTYVDVGSSVQAGDVLVSLDTSELNALLMEARANLASERARLAELERGNRPEEIAVDEAGLLSAETALNDAKNNLSSVLDETYSKIDNIVRNQLDTLFNNGRTARPEFKTTFNDAFLTETVERERYEVELALVDWFGIKSTITPVSDLTLPTKNIKNTLSLVRMLLDDMSRAINSERDSDGTSKATMASARTSFDTVASNILTAEEKYNSAVVGLNKARANLTLTKKGTAEEVVASQNARVSQMEAQVANVLAQISNSTIVAPISGVVTIQDAKVGQVAAANQSVVSIISSSSFEVEANVSEINIGKVHVGDPVQITFDAFPGRTFKGNVYYIDPAQTLVDNVVNFKIKVRFDPSEDIEIVRSGLTVNLEIQSDARRNVLRIPLYAITKISNENFVTKQGDDSPKTKVELGMAGDDGYIEVLSGLSEGDVIVSFDK